MRHRALPSLVVAIPLLVVACSGAPPRPPSERYMADVSNTLSGPRTIVIQRRLRLVTPYSKNTCFRNPKSEWRTWPYQRFTTTFPLGFSEPVLGARGVG